MSSMGSRETWREFSVPKPTKFCALFLGIPPAVSFGLLALAWWTKVLTLVTVVVITLQCWLLVFLLWFVWSPDQVSKKFFELQLTSDQHPAWEAPVLIACRLLFAAVAAYFGSHLVINLLRLPQSIEFDRWLLTR
jgi:hypothetical protein